MKTRILLMSLLVGFLTLGFNISANAKDGFTRIETEEDFRKIVVGKTLRFGESYFVIKGNGRIKGVFRDKALRGNWAWREGYWCRTLTTHRKNTECQVWEYKGKEFFSTRARGDGKGFTYIAD